MCVLISGGLLCAGPSQNQDVPDGGALVSGGLFSDGRLLELDRRRLSSSGDDDEAVSANDEEWDDSPGRFLVFRLVTHFCAGSKCTYAF